MLASDIHPSLILMWQALQRGWKPPKKVSKAMYDRLKAQKGSSPEKAYAGFGYSFGGNYFKGFKPSYGRPQTNLHSQVSAVTSKMSSVKFHRMEYQDLSNLRGWIIYCDPPYANSYQNYKLEKKSAGTFSSSAFWDWARYMSRNNLVFVSEYEAPRDFVSIYSRAIQATNRSGHNAKAVEHLFIYHSWADLLSRF